MFAITAPQGGCACVYRVETCGHRFVGCDTFGIAATHEIYYLGRERNLLFAHYFVVFNSVYHGSRRDYGYAVYDFGRECCVSYLYYAFGAEL